MPAPSSTDHLSSSEGPPGRYSIEAAHLIKRYGSVCAVNGVSLQIRRGEFFSLLGPSGAGKTSVLRLLAGFETPDQGSVSIEGRSMDGVPANRRPVNLVFQSYALFPHLRVRDNIAFGLEMKGLARSEIRERVRDILAMVKLSSREDRWPRELSGGEQQRVALARALINRPAVLLLDEPLSALDQQLRQEMQMELKAIQELVGITFVCVTHHQQEALAMSSRVGVMQEGRLVQVGSPREVYDRPASLSIARFIGESNELQGELRPGDSEDGMMIMTPSQANLSGIKVSGPGRPNWPRKVILSLRPEHLHLSREGIRSGYDNLALGRIEKCLYGGHQTQYVAQLADAVTWKVVMPTARGEEKTFAPGERVWLGWRADEGLIFPE